VNNHDVCIGKLDAGIRFGQAGVVPFLDIAQKNVCQNVACELEIAADAADVVASVTRNILPCPIRACIAAMLFLGI